jgi:nitrate/nitrite transporter NarK
LVRVVLQAFSRDNERTLWSRWTTVHVCSSSLWMTFSPLNQGVSNISPSFSQLWTLLLITKQLLSGILPALQIQNSVVIASIHLI